jgi:hypothetical protein
MKRPKQRGVAYIEFALSSLVLVPLMLGTTAIGINLIRSFQTIQLARDAGHMYARGVDFSQSGNQTVLANLGVNIGLSATSGVAGTAGAGTAVAVLSQVTYVDDATCGEGGSTYVSNGVHTSACTNFGKWVFTQRVIVGNSNMKTSDYGSPVVTGSNPVTIASNGTIDLTDQLTNVGDVATFNSINPYQSVNGTVSGLPSGQMIFISEVAAQGFSMPPIITNPVQYSYDFF